MNTRSETFYESKSENARDLGRGGLVIETKINKNDSKHIEIRRDDIGRFVSGTARSKGIKEEFFPLIVT